MLKGITKMGSIMKLTPVRLKIIVKNSVDKPMMTAKVPTIDNRSFRRLIFALALRNASMKTEAYNLYCSVLAITVLSF